MANEVDGCYDVRLPEHRLNTDETNASLDLNSNS